MRKTSPHPSPVYAQTAALQHLSFFSYLYSAVLSVVKHSVSVKFYGILWTVFEEWYLIFMLIVFVPCIVDNQFTTLHQQNTQCSSLYIYIYTYIFFTY